MFFKIFVTSPARLQITFRLPVHGEPDATLMLTANMNYTFMTFADKQHVYKDTKNGQIFTTTFLLAALSQPSP